MGNFCNYSVLSKGSWIISFSMLLVFANFRNPYSDKCLIRMEYLGDASKPFPILIFYTENSVDTIISADTTYEDFFAHKIQVSEVEFDNINNSIKNIDFKSSPPVLRDSFAVTIHKNNQRKIYFSSGVFEINQTFDSVIIRVQDHEKIKIIEGYINQFKRRLGLVME